ncbi:AraC family transcriptional regulator [Devosia sp. Root685]|uniref:AraC family transcriptional regulator n=1 Tax=Devosia sp. Root685 TaxID=1736587 RepID=UPI0006F1E1D8|nr:AraC family transcriptional regulator [Devosia sp. Root685]KRA99429.1 AraC family transcriptional regulator [Devosia sp. Root685]
MPVLDRVIWQIEVDLTSEVTLQSLSERCAVNIHHMCRVFQLATSMTIMSYVRARRLSNAARAITSSNQSILNVALDAGYGSHEAFTRAFASYFGITPRQLRKEQPTVTLSLMEPYEMNKEMIVPVSAPRKEHRSAFRVVGFGADCSFAQTGAIPTLWQSFNPRAGDVKGAVTGAAYGVCCLADQAGNFRYIAGVEATGPTAGMEAVDLPSQLYAVFTHSGHISDLPKTAYTIWNKFLPEAGMEPAKAPDFERYDNRFDGETGRGVVEIWVPIVS